MRETTKLSPEMRLLLGALLLLALVGGWLLLSHRNADAALPSDGTPQASPPQAAPTQAASSTPEATPSAQPSASDRLKGAVTQAAKNANPNVAAAANAEQENVNALNGTSGEDKVTQVASLPTATPKGINPQAPLSPVPSNNPFTPLTVTTSNAQSAGASSAPVLPPPTEASAERSPQGGQSNQAPAGGVMAAPPVTITPPSTTPLRSGGVMPQTSIALGDQNSRDVTQDIRSRAERKRQEQNAQAGAQAQSAQAQSAQAARTQQEQAKAARAQASAAAKAAQEQAKAAREAALKAQHAQQEAAAKAAAQRAAEAQARAQARTAEPSGQVTASAGVGAAANNGAATSSAGIRGAGAMTAAGANAALPLPNSLPQPTLPSVITQLEPPVNAATSAADSSAAVSGTPLEVYLAQHQIQFNAAVLGPVNTAVFKTDQGFLVVTSGQHIPNTDILVSNVSATQATLSLNADSKTLELNKR